MDSNTTRKAASPNNPRIQRYPQRNGPNGGGRTSEGGKGGKKTSVEVSLDADGIEEFQEAMSKFDSGMQRNVHQYLASLAADIKAEAMRLVPVRAGYLRSTIYARIQEWIAKIGADATYALFVEFGTKNMQAQPYLWSAIQEYLPQLENIICQAIDAARAEANL